MEAPLSMGSYISHIFLVEKRGGGQRWVVNLKSLNSFVKMKHLRFPYITGFNPARGLDDQAGLERCLPSSSNSQRGPTPPPIQMGTEDIPVCVSTIWADLSPTSLPTSLLNFVSQCLYYNLICAVSNAVKTDIWTKAKAVLPNISLLCCM